MPQPGLKNLPSSLRANRLPGCVLRRLLSIKGRWQIERTLNILMASMLRRGNALLISGAGYALYRPCDEAKSVFSQKALEAQASVELRILMQSWGKKDSARLGVLCASVLFLESTQRRGGR